MAASLTYIITITPNPAIDISTSVNEIAPFSKLRCAPPRQDPGGGGINVARVVQRLAGNVTAIYPAGGVSGQLLRRLVEREGVRSVAVPASVETRQDFTVFEEATTRQYRFVLPGARLTEREWQQCLAALAHAEPRPDYIVASGSLPSGVPENFFGKVIQVARELSAKVIIDSSGPPLRAALQEGVYLAKPNLREFRELTGTASTKDADLIESGRGLINCGLVEIIALTMGSRGALLIARDYAIRVDGLPVTPASVVGAGDSFLGAIVWSLARGHNLEIALRYGVAAGSAALINPGTELCQREDVERLVPSVVMRVIPIEKPGSG